MIHEEWRDIAGYIGYYQVSNRGIVRSLDRFIESSRGSKTFLKGQIMVCPLDKYGYPKATLNRDHTRKSFPVHRLVMIAFQGERPKDFQINHINGVKSDNRFENLEYCTASYNRQHAFDNGLSPKGEQHCWSKLTVSDVIEIKRLYALGGITHKEISAIYGVSRATISYILRGESWKHVAA